VTQNLQYTYTYGLTEEDLEFFNEIHHIYKTDVKISIIECDAEIHRIYEYNGKMPKFVQGRGGTAMSPIIDYYNENHY
jgi:predicted metal-dependent peptidase